MKSHSPLPTHISIPQYLKTSADQTLQCLSVRRYCALLGPRFSGKTELLNFVMEELKQRSKACVNINLYATESARDSDFFASLAKIIAKRVEDETGITIPLSHEGVTDSVSFRLFVKDGLNALKNDLVLIFDHLEGAPNDLVRALTSLRVIYMEQREAEYQLLVIVAGALSLAGLTIGETSPFHGIAERVMVDLPPDEECRAYVEEFFSNRNIDVSYSTFRYLIRATRGDWTLITKLCERCALLTTETPSKRLLRSLLEKAIQEFIANDATLYAPLQEALRLIETDADLLVCTLLLINKDTVPRQQLPLPLSPDIDPFYLTGIVRKVKPDAYQFRNEIYRQFLTPMFNPGRVGHLLTMAGRWSQAIDYLEASIKKGDLQYRLDILSATVHSMYASPKIDRAVEHLMRGLSAVFGIKTCRVWYISTDRSKLRFIGGLGKNRPAIGLEIPISNERLEARAFRDVCTLRGEESKGHIEWATPLSISERQPIGVVYADVHIPEWNSARQREWELELTGYLHQAARALHEVQLRHTRQDQLEALDQIALDITLRLDIKQILQISMEKAVQLVGGAGGGIYLWDESSQTFTLEALSGLPLTLVGTKVDKDRGVIGSIRRTKRPYTNIDYLNWSNRQMAFDEYKFNAVVGAPILSGDSFLGVIAVHSHEAGKTFQFESEELLLRFGNHVAAALENASAYRSKQEAIDYRERLISSAPDGIVAVDKDGYVTVYNEGAERICGYYSDEVVNQRMRVDKLFAHPGTARKINSELIKREKLSDYETMLSSKDGESIPITLSATLLRDQNGAPTGSVGFFKDLRPLKASVDTVNAVAQTQDLDDGLNALAKGLVKSLNVTFCQILLMEENRHFLEVKVAYYARHKENLKWKPNVGRKLDVEEAPFIKRLLETSQPSVFRKHGSLEDDEIVAYIQNSLGLENRLETVLIIPLKKGKEILFGVCILGEMQRWDRSMFTIDRIHIADSIAGQAAPLIERMQSNETSQLREGLLRAGREITTLQNLPKILLSIAESIKTALRCDVVTLYTYDEKKGEIDHPPVVAGVLNSPDGVKANSGVNKRSVVWKILTRGEPHFTNNSINDPLMLSDETSRLPRYSSFVERENIRSSAGIPLIVGNDKLGILFVNYRISHPFTFQEMKDIELFATQAAMAVYNARQYDAIRKREKHLQALNDAAEAIMPSVGRDMVKNLDQILKQAVSIASISGAKATLGTIQLVHEQTNEREFTNVFPKSESSKLHAKLGHRISLDKTKTPDGKIGITGRAIITKEPQLVDNVLKDLEYIEYDSRIKSELAVPLIDGSQVIGVLNVESNVINAFDHEDIRALLTLAHLAVVAINNKKQAERLGRANAVGIMGAISADIIHDIKKQVGHIRTTLYLLKRDFGLVPEIMRKIKLLEENVENLVLPRLPKRSSKTGIFIAQDTSIIDDITQAEVIKWQAKYPDLSFQFNGHCGGIRVAMHEQWIIRLLKLLIMNAIKAISPRRKIRKIVVHTEVKGNEVEVCIEDTGKGIRPEIASKLFWEPIPHSDEGDGQGLTLVGFLVEHHGGRAGIKWNHLGDGACIFFSIPIINLDSVSA